ncbi:MAG: major capsid protein [Microvirus sp.]|nr:MAG: major capsid protein [Microvirus sp.]
MNRNKTASQHNFAIIPKTDVPRSKFAMRQTRKQAFNASELVPIMCEEVLPGDTWAHTESIMARLATPIAPAVDDIDLETWYFFVPNRIVLHQWEDFITGKRTNYTLPGVAPTNATATDKICKLNGVFDHFGILPQTYTNYTYFNALPLMGYFKIFNEWFRDENLQNMWTYQGQEIPGYNDIVDGYSNGFNNGAAWDQSCLRLNKRSDYFTRALPWPQKGAAVSIPLGTTAPVTSNGFPPVFWDNVNALEAKSLQVGAGATAINQTAAATAGHQLYFYQQATGLQVDLSAATAATINSLRLAMATQQLLEKDARGGSRYVETLLVHFGVRAPDFRLQRPEYLGGSKIPITVNPIAQTATFDGGAGGTDPLALGNLGAEMHASGHAKTFTYAATEHGYIIGLCAVRATPTYQQGTRKHWKRTARLDFAWPTLANLGEQAVNTTEIFQPANNTPANTTWGYQERYAEYRYTPNEITGVLRSTAPAPLDWWHYAEEFAAEPALNSTFITDKTQETLARSLAVQTENNWSAQIIMDVLHDSQVARLMPAYSVPGLTRF